MTTPSRYSILSSLGKGGMGEVFLADDTQLGRKVAIKFLTEALETDPKALERLHREARSAAALDHPFICKIYELTEIDGRTGIVMEHVSGETLQAMLQRARPSAGRALEIAGEVAEALEEAHRQRVVHRDLKPSNVMVTEQGRVKVMDFGLAKVVDSDSNPVEQAETTQPITESGTRVGTPGYMAPNSCWAPRRTRGPTSLRSALCCTSCLPAYTRSPARVRARQCRPSCASRRYRLASTRATYPIRPAVRWTAC
jgi:serine/threonine protein kinase